MSFESRLQAAFHCRNNALKNTKLGDNYFVNEYVEKKR